MKQAVLAATGKIELREVPRPVPGAGEALVRIRAVGVCGSDLHMFKEGAIGGISIADAGGPFVPGHECMGVVEETGPGADAALRGRRVFVEPAIHCGVCRWCRGGQPNVCPHHHFLGLPGCPGALSEYLVHPARLCEPLPDELSDDAAVLLEPLAIAVHSLDRVGPKPGTAAVVLGAGTIGLVHTLLLARGGIGPLIVTDILDYRLDVARALGATHVLNPQRDDVVAAVKEITGGEGADSVFECAGHPETFADAVRVAAPAGRVGVVGIPVEDRFSIPHSVARRKGLDLLMVRRANLTFERALRRALDGKLPLAALATHHRPLAETGEAFSIAAGYRDGVIKAIVNP